MTATRSENRATWVFFLFTFVFSWGFWGPAALAGVKPGMLAFLAGGSGPTLMGILCTYLFLDRAGRREFWSRAFNPKRVGGAWWAVAVLLFPALMAVAYGVYSLFGGAPVPVDAVRAALSSPLNVFGFVVATLIGGPLAEELGWRGFALSELQKRHSPLAASLLLGGVWAIWHLPLFFMAGTSQAALGVGTASFYLFLVQAVALSVIMAWVWSNTRQSALSAIILHFMFNGSLALLSGMGASMTPGLFGAVAVTVTVFAAGVAAVAGPSLSLPSSAK